MSINRVIYTFMLLVFLAGFGIITYLAAIKIYALPVPAGVDWNDFLRILFFATLILITLRYLGLIICSFLYSLRGHPEQSDYLPSLSIIMPAYNEELVIKEALNALLNLNYPDYEIIVVDDGSTDATYALAKQFCQQEGTARVRILQQKNMGKSEALNRGILAAHGEIILCVDGDSKVDAESLKYSVQHFANPKVGAVAGNVKVANRQYLICRLQALEYIEGLNLLRSAQAFFSAVSIVPGPIGLFRTQAILDVGGYDLDTFAEDCDLTLKLMETGWLIEYQPQAIAWTEAPESLESLLKQRYRWTRGILQAISKHAIRWTDSKRPLALSFWLLYMGVEATLWPIINLSSFALFAYFMLFTSFGDMYWIYWWSLLTFLDVLAAIYCIASENEDWSLAPLAVIYRMFFSLMVDITKLLGTLEELFDIKMEWGKLERKGRL